MSIPIGTLKGETESRETGGYMQVCGCTLIRSLMVFILSLVGSKLSSGNFPIHFLNIFIIAVTGAARLRRDIGIEESHFVVLVEGLYNMKY